LDQIKATAVSTEGAASVSTRRSPAQQRHDDESIATRIRNSVGHLDDERERSEMSTAEKEHMLSHPSQAEEDASQITAGRRPVYVSLTIISIEEIIEENMQCTCQCFLSLSWDYDPSTPEWQPWWEWRNGTSNVTEISRVFKQPAQTAGNSDRSTLRVAFHGSFKQNFDLKTFPVDFQKLRLILIASEECYFRRSSSAQDSDMAKWLQDSYGLLQWEPCLKKHILGEGCTGSQNGIVHVELSQTSPEQSCSGIVYTKATFRAFVFRRSASWIYGAILPLMCVSTCSLLHFGEDPRNVGSRLRIDFTLLLAMVSQKFTLANRVPVLPYLTLLDRHFLWNIGACMILALQAGLMRPVYEIYCDESQWVVIGGTCTTVQTVDRWCMGAAVVMYIVLHLGYLDRISARHDVLATWRWVQKGWGKVDGKAWTRGTSW